MVARLSKNAMLTCYFHGLVSSDANKSISKIGQSLVKIRGHGRPRKFSSANATIKPESFTDKSTDIFLDFYCSHVSLLSAIFLSSL
jgi:hypothetical protein